MHPRTYKGTLKSVNKCMNLVIDNYVEFRTVYQEEPEETRDLTVRLTVEDTAPPEESSHFPIVPM